MYLLTLITIMQKQELQLFFEIRFRINRHVLYSLDSAGNVSFRQQESNSVFQEPRSIQESIDLLTRIRKYLYVMGEIQHTYLNIIRYCLPIRQIHITQKISPTSILENIKTLFIPSARGKLIHQGIYALQMMTTLLSKRASSTTNVGQVRQNVTFDLFNPAIKFPRIFSTLHQCYHMISALWYLIG